LDIISLITDKTASIALAVVVMYYYNQLVTDVMKERKEMIESLRNDRREWLTAADGYLQQTFLLIRTSSESLSAVSSQLNALKGEIAKYFLDKEIRDLKDKRQE